MKQDKAMLEIQVPGGNSNGSRSHKTQGVGSLKLGKFKIPWGTKEFLFWAQSPNF